MTAPTHPLFGRLLDALSFKRLGGVMHLVVVLPDGSPGTIRAEATSVFGELLPAGEGTALSVEGIRHLRVLVAAHPRGRRSRGRGQGRK